MKSVLTSIRPTHTMNIILDRKRWEIRKDCPKLGTPFKVHIYCTKNHSPNGHDLLEIHNNGKIHKANCKVVGEFICDEIVDILPCTEYYSYGYDVDDDMLKEICLTREELMDYGKGRKLFAWHITELVVYYEPKELRNFFCI